MELCLQLYVLLTGFFFKLTLILIVVFRILYRLTIISHLGDILHTFTAPLSKTPLTAFTWAHEDTTVIIAAGGSIATGIKIILLLMVFLKHIF